MIQFRGLSLYYWVKVINYENYILNKNRTKALKNITSKEAWASIKLDVRHFHIFGSVT